MLQYFIQTGEKMKPTQVLKYLIEKLKENGIIMYDKDFLDYIDIKTDTKHIKRLSDHLRRSGDIRDKTFLKAIEEKFGFEKSIWSVCESSQTERIKEAIERALILQKLPDKDALNLSTIIQVEHPMNKNQKSALHHFQTLSSKEILEKTIDDYLGSNMLERKIENQEFLVALLHLAYDKGLYSIIVEFILPNLYVSYRQRTDVQKIEAHTLGSLQEYKEAKHILHLLIHHNTIENINLRTSALSNHKRELFASQEPLQKETLSLLIEGYQKLHTMEGIYSYYTGINLLYMVVLAQLTFPEDETFSSIELKDIYKLSKPSLKKDKTHHDYYVTMSELEFKLLLEYEGILEKIESFLANETPHTSLVERTLRQMKLFTNHIEKSKHPLVALFQKAIGILEGYCHID